MSAAGRARAIVLAGVLVGAAARAAALWVAPAAGYLPDHLDHLAWAAWAREHGPAAIYDMRPDLVPVLVADPATGRATTLATAPHAYNYPPLAAWVFSAKGALWQALDDDVVTVPAPGGGTRAVRTANTRLARTVDALPSFAFDLVLALGVLRLARLLGAGPAAGAAALALVVASPVVILDATLWGQSDAWIAAALVWTIVWWLRGRFVAAGLVYGLALVLKPQAILLGPVLAFALLAVRRGPDGTAVGLGRALAFVPAALVAAAAGAAPAMVHDARAGAGAWRWLARSYGATVGGDAYAFTTLYAFNVWWLDLLAERPWTRPDEWWGLLDARATVLGVSKDAAGFVALGAAIALAAAASGRRAGAAPAAALVSFAFAVLLSAFLLPTRVHERYAFYAVPFATALAAAGARAWLVPWVLVTALGTGEMLSHLWVAPTPAACAASGALAVAGLIALAWTWRAAGALNPPGARTRSRSSPGSGGSRSTPSSRP